MGTTLEDIRFNVNDDALRNAANAVNGLRGQLQNAVTSADAFNSAQQRAFGASVSSVQRLDRAIQGIQFDKVSAAANAVTNQMNREVELAAKLQTFDATRVRNIAKMESELARMNKEATKGIGEPEQGGKDQQGAMEDALRQVGGEAAVIQKAAEAIKAIISAVIQITEAGAKLAISATSFRESTEKSFEFLLGSATAARDLYEKALDVADEVGLDKELVVAKLKTLINSGFGKDAAIAAIEAAGNIAQVAGQEGAEKLLDIFTKAKAGGVFDTKLLKGLREMGVQLKDVYAQLAKDTGKSLAEVEAAFKAGRVSAEEGTKAIEEVINEKLGGAGSKAGQTFERLFGDLKGNFERLFDDVDLSPLKSAMSTIIDAMKGPEGKAIKSALNDIFGGLFDALFGGLDADRIKGIMSAIGDALGVVGRIVKASAPMVKAFIGGLIDGFLAAWPAIKAVGSVLASLFESLGGSSAVISAFRILGEVIGFVAGVIGVIIGVLTTFWSAIAMGPALLIELYEWISNLGSSLGGDLRGALEGLPDAFIEAGEAMIDGMVGAITGGSSQVVQAVLGMAEGAVDAAEAALGIKSPSKRFAMIGKNSVLGYTGEVEAANDNVRAATGSFAKAAIAGASDATSDAAIGGSAVGGARGGGNQQTNHVNVNLPPATMNFPEGTTPAQAHAIGQAAQRGQQEEVERQLLAALRKIGEAA